MTRRNGEVIKCVTCGEEGNYFFYPEEPRGNAFCEKHAREAGFCPSCGSFVAGIEIEDFTYIPKYGVCSSCFEAMEDEIASPDGEEWEEYDNE
ncbi:MAG: hypothetical protein KIS29_09900 [Thermoplasmata archaeon]|nr:hypothetical protein [Candidatus Sysuiplasma jiujiangense]